MGQQYVAANAKKESNNYTYPHLGSIGGDCANFTSQCILASGLKHFQDDWYIYKKNNTYKNPTSISQLDYSWNLADPSAWISAARFNRLWWYSRPTTDYTGQYILNNPNTVYNAAHNTGDAIQILKKDSLGVWVGYHTMYLSGYGTYNGNKTYLVSYHSSSQYNKPLLEVCSYYTSSNYKFRFFDF